MVPTTEEANLVQVTITPPVNVVTRAVHSRNKSGRLAARGRCPGEFSYIDHFPGTLSESRFQQMALGVAVNQVLLFSLRIMDQGGISDD